jgi:diguanylate cyclase (GGDEF)-like protein/PAS domain S-box-containing protein
MEQFDQLPSPVLVTDCNGRIQLCNTELIKLIGGSAEHWQNRPIDDLLPPAGRIFLQTHVWPLLIREDNAREIYLHLVDSTRQRIPVLVNCHRGHFQGKAHYYWVFFVAQERSRFEAALLDARSQAQRIAAELADQHELLQVTMQSIGDAVITTDASGAVTWLNPVAERMTGWSTADARGQALSQVFHIIHEDTRVLTENPVAQCLQLGQTVNLAKLTLLVSRNGTEYGIEDSAAPIRNAQGVTLGAVLVFHDVTVPRRMAREMKFRATHDALTGLGNRAEFETRLQRVLFKAHEDASEHALLYIDLDQFKLVNDTCGHAAGDQLLQQVARLLRVAIRDRDTLARLGGDEFGIILEHCSVEHSQRVAEQICERMEDFRFSHNERRFRVGTSIGLVTIHPHWLNTEAILQAADAACYAAKDAGRNRVHTWLESDLEVRARHGEMQWTTRIEHALDNDLLVLYAQRIEALSTPNHGIHAEVLVRMRDTDGSLIPPGAFLPAAERFHLASRIDKWVLNHTIAWMQSLPCFDAVENLSINISGQSAGDRAFQHWAIEVLKAAGPSICARLCFEITETAAVTHLADAAQFMAQVRALGLRVALDDFGAGASSFGYLKSLPVDYLKIDGQFIRDLVDDPLDDVAVRCFVEVARVVRVKTVAEFVDKPEVLARLKAIGVDMVQGYWLHRPAPIDQLQPHEWLADHRPGDVVDVKPLVQASATGPRSGPLVRPGPCQGR